MVDDKKLVYFADPAFPAWTQDYPAFKVAYWEASKASDVGRMAEILDSFGDRMCQHCHHKAIRLAVYYGREESILWLQHASEDGRIAPWPVRIVEEMMAYSLGETGPKMVTLCDPEATVGSSDLDSLGREWIDFLQHHGYDPCLTHTEL
jgi:hypothetical protein